MRTSDWHDDERLASIALACISEPLDPWVGKMFVSSGAVHTIELIRSGTSRVSHRQGMQARLHALDLDAELSQVEKRNMRIVTRGDAEWPTQLEDLGERVPRALWIDGSANVRLAAATSVAIVGARACTRYGAEAAYEIASRLTTDGVRVMSGGAFGIDAAAHRGALGAGGITLCVLACGVDVPYPRSHDALLLQIAQQGALVSESPLGSGVRRQRFLSRNRIIAALTRATIVIEAATRSGSLSTAHEAEAINRVVGALPGPITSEMSRGTHQLIRESRAVLVTSAAEVGELISPTVTSAPTAVQGDLWFEGLGDTERAVLDALPHREAMNLDELVLATALSPRHILEALGSLEVAGRVRTDGSGWRISVAPASGVRK
ncbi:MAG: DNA-processing protein DprA [Candidatus Nanopelagicales bacterium]|nr:DNA-processing protein DprA [Candidatus Nanopelagicales bacterium]